MTSFIMHYTKLHCESPGWLSNWTSLPLYFCASLLSLIVPSSFLRFYTMSIMMAVDLLGCTGSTEERAALLHKTIQLAAELKSNLGNMFGFAAVMRALELPQVKSERMRERLEKVAIVKKYFSSKVSNVFL